ncbi:MAG: hypothetical protein J6K53_10410 [Roseburia sp.]|nr:hypothetical protein [Roseburia sp.]
MYGFVYETLGENEVLVKPFWDEELVAVFGTAEQIAEIQTAKEQSEQVQENEPTIVFYDEESMMLEEEDAYGELAG